MMGFLLNDVETRGLPLVKCKLDPCPGLCPGSSQCFRGLWVKSEATGVWRGGWCWKPRYPGPPRVRCWVLGLFLPRNPRAVPTTKSCGSDRRTQASPAWTQHISICWCPGCEGSNGGSRHWASGILTLQRGGAFTEVNFLKRERVKQDIYAENYNSKRHLPPVFITALFTIATTWKQPRCPSTGEWIKKPWRIYATEYYSTIKRTNLS